jgi:hypothetical protein
MRPPARPCVTGPGPASPMAERALTHLRRLEFYDPDGLVYGLPTYPWRMAPAGYATIRQLRAQGLRPGGQPVQAQIIWWHGGRRTRNGRSGRERRVAWLYRVDLAKPKRTATPRQLVAIGKALSARMTCPSCGNVQPYCIAKSLGECNACADRARGRAA